MRPDVLACRSAPLAGRARPSCAARSARTPLPGQRSEIRVGTPIRFITDSGSIGPLSGRSSRSITAEFKETAAFPSAVDLSASDDPQRLIDEAVAPLGGIDVLIDNVGVDHDKVAKGAVNDVLTLPESAWEHSFTPHLSNATPTKGSYTE